MLTCPLFFRHGVPEWPVEMLKMKDWMDDHAKQSRRFSIQKKKTKICLPQNPTLMWG